MTIDVALKSTSIKDESIIFPRGNRKTRCREQQKKAGMSNAMASQQSIDLLFISLLILFLVLVVLIVLCWVFKHFKNRNLTEMRISAGQPPLRMVIRTKPEHAQQLMDHLMDRFIFQEETGPDCKEAFTEEHEQVTSNPSKSQNVIPKKMSQWISMALPAQQARKREMTLNSRSPCTDQSQAEIHALQQQDEPQHALS
ncbi:hypothetical protein CHARACLAT_013749 [Characodon lateralis]|uniref:Uncharacterized protein n=1 Tax=Characodon lateralis TaxID=208331 RepID=A0ABU7DKB8_9TELE|nr:hypothetical protein [Characodon lateralis]